MNGHIRNLPPESLVQIPAQHESPDISPPETVEEAERLVQSFYQPASPSQYSKLDKALKDMQRSPNGFKFADALMASENANVRFFGCLTFTVKINCDWKGLGAQEADELLSRLLFWFIHLVATNNPPFVIRKLCSSLVAVFVQSDGHWPHCVRHVLYCFQTNHSLSATTIEREGSHFADASIERLSAPQLMATQWFATALLEETEKMNTDSILLDRFRSSLNGNLLDIIKMIEQGANIAITSNPVLARESVRSFSALLAYMQVAFASHSEELVALRQLSGIILSLWEIDQLFEVTSEAMIDMLTNYVGFLPRSEIDGIGAMLVSPRTDAWIQQLLAGDFNAESLLYGRLLLAYAEVEKQELAMNWSKPSNHKLFTRLLDCMKCSGIAIVEDEIVSQALEYWSNYAEHLVDLEFEEQRQPWVSEAGELLRRVTEIGLVKIRMPSVDEYQTWDSDTKAEFQTFRRDFQFFVASVYMVAGHSLFEDFVAYSLVCAKEAQWSGLEAILFCLNGLADTINDQGRADQSLTVLFSSPIFDPTKGGGNSPMDPKTQQTVVSLIGNYATYFERNPSHLENTLRFLFSMLENTNLVAVSAKTIHTLCTCSRNALIPIAPDFVQHFREWVGQRVHSYSVKEKLAGAIAAIIQAMTQQTVGANSSESLGLDSVAALEICDWGHSLINVVSSQRVRELISRDVNEAPSLSSPAPYLLSHMLDTMCLDLDLSLRAGGQSVEEARAAASGLLLCIVSIGKAFRTPEDSVVDIDATMPPYSVWNSTAGQRAQQRILEICSLLLGDHDTDGEITEHVCQVLRAGYTEMDGPFVFPLEATESMFHAIALGTPRIGVVLETVGVLLKKHSKNTFQDRSEDASKFSMSCLSKALQLVGMRIQGNPSNDPEVASSTLEFVRYYVPNYLDVMFNEEIRPLLSDFFELSLRCLASTEILPKRNAADFWAKFIHAGRVQHDMSNATAEQVAQAMVDATVNEYGARLTLVLIRGIGGEASRSDLDSLSAPLKALIFRGGQVKGWLEQALFSQEFPAESKVVDTEKRQFLEAIMRLRGAAKTTSVVKSFWVTCRGTYHLG